MNYPILSFDTDWAPNYILEDIINILIKNRVKATWFITHNDNYLKLLKENNDLFEIGIHPCFFPNSSQGKTEEEILVFLNQLIPEATVCRTHGVYQYGGLLGKIVKNTNVKIDSSIFLPEMEGIKKVNHLTPYGVLIRIPFFWADDYELLKVNKEWNILNVIKKQGIKVLLFHPVHIYLNTCSFEQYNDFKESTKGKNFIDLKKNEVEQFVNSAGKGINNLFKDVVNLISEKKSSFLSQV